MIRKLILWVLSLQCLVVEGQQLKLGNNPSTINKTSLLELESNNQGLLLTRIPDTTVSTLTGAPTGMLIFFNGDSTLRLRKGGRWQTVSLSGLPWLLGGNVLTGVQPFGTLSNTDLPFYTNNVEQMRLTAGGFLGIGTKAPATALHVFGTNPLTLTGVQTGAATDSVLTIVNGLVRKLAASNYATNLSNGLSGYNVTINSSTGSGTTFALPKDSLSRLLDVSETSPVSGQLLQYNGSQWVNMTPSYQASGISWLLGGNGSTSGSTNFLGTTNSVGLHIRTNNVERMYLDSVNGTVGIGTDTFTTAAPEKLLVNAGATSSYNAIVARGTVANYFQLNINNQSNNSGASSDVVTTADNGTESVNYVDLGINSSQYNTSSITGGPDNAYLYSTGNDFVIGNATSGHNLLFFTGGTASTNEAMRINGSGNIGMGTTNPGNRLEVNSGTGGASGLRLKELPSGAVLFMSSTSDVAQNNNNFYFDAVNYRLGIAAGTTPASTVQVGGSLGTAIVTKTANYTASGNDYTILCNNTASGITISLPTAAGCAGRVYVIKKISPLGNTVTISGFNGSQTIDGSTTYTLLVQYSSVIIQSDGTNWWIL